MNDQARNRRTSGSATRSRPFLYLRAARRPLGARHPSLRRPDDRMVFVFGSPRSGTTFLARALGSLPGFVDLGEVHPLKAAVHELAAADPAVAAARVRRTLDVVRRLGLVGARRAVEQTPETAFLLPAVVRAFPRGAFVHLVRDGRDVVCSLLERGWLAGGRGGADDAGEAYGAHARFWVERGREEEFAAASDARRAAWAWRRYVGSARRAGVPVHELRYEQLVTSRAEAAAGLAEALEIGPEAIDAALRGARSESIGRHRRDLSGEQLAEVEHEAGELLRELGYLDGAAAPPERADP